MLITTWPMSGLGRVMVSRAIWTELRGRIIGKLEILRSVHLVNWLTIVGDFLLSDYIIFSFININENL